ncbi:MAG: class I SAM-dependent methyltransferase [Porticoccus sp.]|nr:class I SAM-dependent methyltransferase [Porticoccus sp.]
MSRLSNKLSKTTCIAPRPGYECRAELLSLELKLPVFAFDQTKDINEGLALVVDDLGLSLLQLGRKAPGPVRCDFLGGATQHRRLYGGGKGQDIAKAVGLHHKGFKPQVLDLTAGLGRDGFVLASLGASVVMLERNPIVFALLEDGLSRAREGVLNQSSMDEVADLAGVLSRISSVGLDACTYLSQLEEQSNSDERYPDVIYVDPMFPAREKSSKVKKEMQLFHQLVGADDDGSDLLPLALKKVTYRVVVKRPVHAPFLAEQKPGYSLKGKSTRFDIYPIKKLPG